MKTCINCGNQLPDQAAWCPYCETDQTEPKTVKTPVRRRRWILAVIAAAAALCAILLAVRVHHRPKVYEGGAEVSYRLGKENFRIFLSFRTGAGQTGEAMQQQEVRIREGDSAAMLSLLFVQSEEDGDAGERFLEQAESFKVTASAMDDKGQMEVNGPHDPEGLNTDAISCADIGYFSDTGTNSICWEITMKNRDTIRLYQTIDCSIQPVVTYYWEDTPMETIDQLNALIEKTAKEESEDTILELYLPPVTYEEPLTMDTRTAYLYGSEEDGKKTTFTDTVTVQTREPYPAEFYNLEFAGDGGTGIRCTDALMLRACVFTGWDIGLDVKNGGWASVSNAAFVENGTGMRFDSQSSTYSNPTYENVVFAENETGMEILSVPGGGTLSFIDPVFDNNKTDMVDPDNLVQLS